MIVCRDYSLRKRIPTEEKKFVLKRNKKDYNEHDSKLQCLEIDNSEPLTSFEWNNLSLVLAEVEGIAWFQVLPVGQKSSQPLQFNMIHFLPKFKFPVKKLPLQQFVEAKL